MNEHVLHGCRPTPLASYLKGLAVLRLVSEQTDAKARGAWRGDTFVLQTTLGRDALLGFFLHDYRPSPIVAPWNGGSGFYTKGTHGALARISSSSCARLGPLREAIAASSKVLTDLGIEEKVTGDRKARLLEACRGAISDEAVRWLDAAYLLTKGRAQPPPLLGTGGNDGNLEFTNNFMQRLLDVIDASSGGATPHSSELLRAALNDEPSDHFTGGAIGQFLPFGAGGANAASGFDGSSRFNPWDFVLMLEGAILFAAASVRRMELEQQGALSYPFTVRATGTAYTSAAGADEGAGASRGELWLPVWDRPALFSELQALFAEGRVRVAGRPARNGLDFARAVATLGVDRGIRGFQRYGLLVRNGLSYLATPTGRVAVREDPSARLLDEIDGWLDTFRRRAAGDRAPASVRRALRVLEDAIFALCRRGGPDALQKVLIALGGCERVMARSQRWAQDPKSRVTPVPPLSPEWLTRADDGSPELRLAAALASVVTERNRRLDPLRRQMEPVTAWKDGSGRSRVDWDATAGPEVVWSDGDLVTALNAVMKRRLILYQQWGAASYGDVGKQPAALADIAAFVDRRTDDRRIGALLWGCVLIDWQRCGLPLFTGKDGAFPPALYALLKLCFPGAAAVSEHAPPLIPRIQRLAAAGDGLAASRAAARRLRASGLPPALDHVHQPGEPARRIAAALLFPLDRRALAQVRRSVLRPVTQPGEPTQ